MLFILSDHPTKTYLSNRSDAAALEQEINFQNLDSSLQTFIKAYVGGQADLQALISDQFWATKASIRAAMQTTNRQIEKEGSKTREHISSTQATVDSRREHDSQRMNLLKSLDDPEKNARRNQIERSHSKTFSWIFEEEIERPWDSFTEWLISTNSTYWISGKAGSGKSTLMKFLVDHERTRYYLDKWAPDCSIYAHFIWNSGTEAQRSILGLLRSLLFQILERNHYIVDMIMLERPRLLDIKNPLDWSRNDLEESLDIALHGHKTCVCIFIDGLDEIDPVDGPFKVLNLIERLSTLSSHNRLKFCVSSRPENAFKARLGSCPKLRLQDLTKLDVEVYAKEFVKNKCSFDLSGIDETAFIEEIVSKANGVFLWVSLALKSLQRGVINGDDPARLMERLRKLPSELGKLYDEMLRRLGDDQELYSKEAAMIFNTFILMSEIQLSHGRRWNLLEYATAFDSTLREKLLKWKSSLPPTSLKKTLLDLDIKLTSRCAGILEVVSDLQGVDIARALAQNVSRPWASIGVEFLHRSAKEFLLSSRNELLAQDPTTAVERRFRVLQAIILDDCFPRGRKPEVGNAVFKIMSEAKPPLSDKQEIELLNLTQEIYQQNGWYEFYEVATRYGLYKPLENLFENTAGDLGPLRSYLLLCAVNGYTGRTNATVSFLLDQGAYSENSFSLTQMSINGGKIEGASTESGSMESGSMESASTESPSTREGDHGRIYFLQPLLGNFFNRLLYYNVPHDILPLLEGMFQSFIKAGLDLDERFLTFDFALSTSFFPLDASKCRPQYSYLGLDPSGCDLLVERTAADLLYRLYLSQRHLNHVEISAIASRLGLDISRAHQKILLFSHADAVYGLSDKDSDHLSEILGWRYPILSEAGRDTRAAEDFREDERSEERSDKMSVRTSSTVDSLRDHDQELDQELDQEGKEREEKILELLKGKEVYDVKKWLVDRGYILVDEQDLEGISDGATVHEMAAIYQRLGQKYLSR